MKKILLTIIIISIFNKGVQAQDDGAAAALAGAFAIGSAIAAVELAKEIAEQQAMEFVLTKRPDLNHFELKTDSFTGVKGKDLSTVSFLTFTIRDFKNLKRYMLYGFRQSGFSNSQGLDYSNIEWKMFDVEEWNTMMSAYVELASGIKLSPLDITNVKIVNKGVKQNGKFIVSFDKQNGDEYKVLDYSEDFKLVYNERSLGLFLKSIGGDDEFVGRNKSSLVQVRRKIIISSHEFLNLKK